MSEPEPIYYIADARSQIETLKAENQRLQDQLAAIKREWHYGTEVHATPWRRRMAWLIGDEENNDV